MEEKNKTSDIDKFDSRHQTNDMPVPVVDQQTSFFASIERLAANPDVDVAKIKQLMDMQEHVLDRNAKQAFNVAMVRAQAKIPRVPKDLKNNQTNSMYSAYETILKYTKPVYTEAGFSVLMYEGDTEKEGCIRVCADVGHEDGHTKKLWTDVPIDDKGIKGIVNKTLPHAKKSSLSYGKGILMCMIFNIPTGDVDDDGNAAGFIGANDQQILDIQTLQRDAKLSDTEFTKRLKAKFKVDKIESLTETQAVSLIKSLEAIKNA